MLKEGQKRSQAYEAYANSESGLVERSILTPEDVGTDESSDICACSNYEKVLFSQKGLETEGGRCSHNAMATERY